MRPQLACRCLWAATVARGSLLWTLTPRGGGLRRKGGAWRWGATLEGVVAVVRQLGVRAVVVVRQVGVRAVVVVQLLRLGVVVLLQLRATREGHQRVLRPLPQEPRPLLLPARRGAHPSAPSRLHLLAAS